MKERRYTDTSVVFGPGKASDYIKPFESLGIGDKVVICCRVSERKQKRTQNLDDQERNLRRTAEQAGLVVVAVLRYVRSGFDPCWLVLAARIAKRHGATILAETTCRLVRNQHFHSSVRPNAQPTEEELRNLASWTDGVPLATHLAPDASPYESRSYHRKRGQWAKGRKGGRPRIATPGYKKRRRVELLPRAMELHQEGESLRSIEVELKVPFTTIRDWIRDSIWVQLAHLAS